VVRLDHDPEVRKAWTFSARLRAVRGLKEKHPDLPVRRGSVLGTGTSRPVLLHGRHVPGGDTER